MIKKIIKILLVSLFIIALAILYLSTIGIKTDKFNNQINDNILKIDKRINLKLSDVKYLLSPYDLTINIKTSNIQLLLDGRSLSLEEIQTNVALKPLINSQFSIDDLQIKTKEIKLNDIIALVRLFQNSPQLFILDKITQNGFVKANIDLNFDENGRIKENYNIEGSVRKVKLDALNQFKLKNLNFDFNIKKNIYSLKQIDMNLNNIKLTSSLIDIKKRKKLFFINGQFSNEQTNFDIEEFKSIFNNFFNNMDIQKIVFSSKNIFSFNINKNLKFDNLKVKSAIDLNQLIINKKNLKLKPYLPNLGKEIKLTQHKIHINFSKDKIDMNGNGKILLNEKADNFSYQIIKNIHNLLFDLKINLKNNSLLIDFLDYKKKENLSSLISIKGNLKNNNQLTFDLINLKEMNNEISVEGLDLSNNLKIIDIKYFNIDYKNNKKIINKLNLKKDNSNFIIEGESFDASRIINNIIDSDKESAFIFKNLNSKIKIRIKKTYIDDINYMNNLYGNIYFKNNKIENLKLDSTFPNKKKINLSIETNKNSETITKLFSTHPKPLIKRYDFIKGFEDGNLNFYSSKKEGISNSVLIIDNFKVKEVPIFAKLLSLASLQGMADLLTGEGIRFTDFEMQFSNKKGLTTIEEMYAIGPAVSLIMEGYIESKKLVSLKGTIVPATTINRTIASIPLLGKILVGGKTGDGVFGVSFKIKGTPKDLKTTVNPIKTLTPRFISRTLEKIKNN